MLENASPDKHYFVKILTLLLSSFLAYFSIWYALVREESVDWIAGHIVHQPWPYAITEDKAGLLVNNVIEGFEINFPVGWQAEKEKNPQFFRSDKDGKRMCEVVISFTAGGDGEKDNFPQIENGPKKVLFGKSEAFTDKKGLVYYISLSKKFLVMEFRQENKECEDDFDVVKKSFVYYKEQKIEKAVDKMEK